MDRFIDIMNNELLAYLILFLMFGGGFLVAFLLLVISSRLEDLKNRLIFVAFAFFVLITQHACYYSLDGFAAAFGNHGNAVGYAYLAYFTAGLWSLYILRKSNAVIAIRKFFRHIAHNTKLLLVRTFARAKMYVKLFIQAEHARYERIKSRRATKQNDQ